MKVIGDLFILLKCFLPAVSVDSDELAINALGPPAEVADLAANLLLLGAGGVRCEREVWIGFYRLREPLGTVRVFLGRSLSPRIGHASPRSSSVRWRRLRRIAAAGGQILYR